MKVAYKFCGGCDPSYERVDYWEAIRAAAGDRITWQRLEEGGHQILLLICGCEKACPRGELPEDEKVLIVKNSRLAPAEVVARLLGRES